MSAEASSFDQIHVLCRPGYHQTRLLAALLFLTSGSVLALKAFACFRALEGSWAFICLEHVDSGFWQ